LTASMLPAVPPVPVHELAQLMGRMRRPSINAQEEVEEERFTRRTRNSARMLGGNRVASQRRRIRPSNEVSADEMVNRARGRQHRVASVPDQRVVEQVRQEERERGGPSAPRNSLDLSAMDVNETIDVNDESDDGENIEEDLLAVELDGQDDENTTSLIPNVNEYMDIQGVPPRIPSSTINALESDESEANSLDVTIDLTESPVRIARPVSIPTPMLPPPPRSQQRIATPSSPVSSPKCPVCLESFRAVHRRGNRLVSTLCGHVFCGRCLPACVRTSGHCPTCRKRIGYDDFHPLFLF